MLQKRHFLFIVLISLFCSCNNSAKHPYAIKDFRKKLQPYLTQMVNEGIVMGVDSVLQQIATDDELVRLINSEHPILRAAAFPAILERKTINHFEILMGHLDDTALIAMEAVEFGLWYRSVSDYILEEAYWETQEEKDKTVERVLTKHNYLRSAYFILEHLEPQEKYYSYIMDMATRPRRLSDEGAELYFDDIEYALYGLAKFKKQEDIRVIRSQLMHNIYRLSNISFKLMNEYPDTAYFDVLQEYHRRVFYKLLGNRRERFSGVISEEVGPEDFIHALVKQQNNKSALLLDTMLNWLLLQIDTPDKEEIINMAILEIWENPCVAYLKLRAKIKPKAEQILKNRISVPMELHYFPVNTTKRKIYWASRRR
jgi:hypothetical protein